MSDAVMLIALGLSLALTCQWLLYCASVSRDPDSEWNRGSRAVTIPMRLLGLLITATGLVMAAAHLV